jgi:SAM-dependent methyltransferase
VTARVGAAFDRIAEQYAADFADELTRKPWDVAHLLAFAAGCADGLVLDVGCGAAGHVGRFVAERGLRVTGVDASPRSVGLARRLNSALSFLAADVRALPVRAHGASGVVAFYALIYEADPTAALLELARVLRPGGPLLLAAHAGAGILHFAQYKGVVVDIDVHLRSATTLAERVRAAGFAVTGVETRRPYPFEHATERLYLSATRTGERRPDSRA